MFDGKAYGEGIVEIVKGYFEREIAPLKAENDDLKARLKALEDRPAPEVIHGDPGKDADLDAINQTIAAEVAKAVSAIRVPEDGKDAPGFSDVLKDNGELVIVLQDGTVRRTGICDGKDGEPGRDGFGFEDMDVAVLDDDRTIELSFRRGDEEKAFTLKWPTVIDRGIWKEGHPYSRGDSVTWGGSSWIAQQDEPPGKPDTKDSGWRLAVKKGRDGKDGKNG